MRTELSLHDARGRLVFDPPIDETPVDQAARHELIAEVGAAVANLPENEATVLRWRYGLAGCSTATQSEIAVQLGVSRQRIEQIERRARKRLSVSKALREMRG